MALFEFEQGHLIPAQFGHPVNKRLSPELLEAIRGQVLEVISRPLFPVTWHDNDGDELGSQRLTALDPSGQVVSVEVLARLEPVNLIAALSRLGGVASLGWIELAERYPGGSDAFRTGWTEFREAMPPTAQPGPRLIIVTGQVDDSVRPALGVLFHSGMEIHEVRLREMSNGRQFIEVNPLREAHVDLRLEATANSQAQLAWQDQSVENTNTSDDDYNSSDTDADNKPVEKQHNDTVEEAIVENEAPSYREPYPLEKDEDDKTDNEDETDSSSDISHEEKAETKDSLAQSHDMSKNDTRDYQQQSSGETKVREHGSPRVPVPGVIGLNAEGLHAISQIIGQDATILWHDPQENRDYQALLKTDGIIECEDGYTTSDVEDAFGHATGRVDIIGWKSWRIGHSHGPTLSEAIDEINAEIYRETQAAHHHRSA